MLGSVESMTEADVAAAWRASSAGVASAGFPSSHTPPPKKSLHAMGVSSVHSSPGDGMARSLNRGLASATKRSGSLADDILRTSLAAQPKGGGQTFSQDFVSQLQRQHQARLQETLSTSQAMLTDKERELDQLHRRMRDMKAEFTRREDGLLRDIDKLKASHDEERAVIRSDMQQLATKYEQEAASLRADHESELSVVRNQAQQDAANALSKVEGEWSAKLNETLQAHRQHADGLQRENAQMQAEYESKIQVETEQLALVREDLYQMELSKGREILELKNRLETLTRQSYEKEARQRQEQHTRMQEASGRVSSLEREISALKAENASLRSRAAGVEQSCEHRVQTLVEELDNVRVKLAEIQEQSRRDVSALNAALESGQEFSQRQLEQNRQLVDMVRNAQSEAEMFKQEISSSGAEARRLREENEDLRSEVERLDRIVYGGKRQ